DTPFIVAVSTGQIGYRKRTRLDHSPCCPGVHSFMVSFESLSIDFGIVISNVVNVVQNSKKNLSKQLFAEQKIYLLCKTSNASLLAVDNCQSYFYNKKVTATIEMEPPKVSVIGTVLNVSAVILICRTPSFHNAFGYICASHLLADVGVLVMFLFWAAPAAILGVSKTITLSYFGERMGQITMLFWYASIYGQLQIALNRLVAISSPLLYNSTFSTKRTVQILVAFWLLSAAHVAIYFFDDCDFVFDTKAYIWTYAGSQCGNIISFYLDFLHGTTLCCIVVLVNTISFFAIIKEAKGCVQAGCFALMILSFHFFSKFATTKWATFAVTTFVWELCHAMDGLVLTRFTLLPI
ncbi:unnamed protein product, partial [Haemonchus placei]|uniref:G_PROTEIN_RECEP_F1_2 domain-containing protein n=1 Tax=Haemonchus placei TaxID=6290 RepID=A0A158QQ85_HAEPC